MNDDVRAMRDVFLQELLEQMRQNARIFFLTADFGSPVIDKIKEEFPNRFINVGIAEQNLINVATGLALEGFIVYAYAIAPFITMRCFEQIRINLAILSQVRPMNVNLIGVGAGFSYVVSGPTHQCLEDLSIMRTLPNIELFSPADWRCTQEFVGYSLRHECPKYIRLDAQPLPEIYGRDDNIDIKRGFTEITKGGDIGIVATGYMTRRALRVAQFCRTEGTDIGVIDLYMLKSLSRTELNTALKKYSVIISCEEGFIGKGGLDSFLLHFLNDEGLKPLFRSIGLAETYNFHIGSRDNLHDRNQAGDRELINLINEMLIKEV